MEARCQGCGMTVKTDAEGFLVEHKEEKFTPRRGFHKVRCTGSGNYPHSLAAVK